MSYMKKFVKIIFIVIGVFDLGVQATMYGFSGRNVYYQSPLPFQSALPPIIIPCGVSAQGVVIYQVINPYGVTIQFSQDVVSAPCCSFSRDASCQVELPCGVASPQGSISSQDLTPVHSASLRKGSTQLHNAFQQNVRPVSNPHNSLDDILISNQKINNWFNLLHSAVSNEKKQFIFNDLFCDKCYPRESKESDSVS